MKDKTPMAPSPRTLQATAPQRMTRRPASEPRKDDRVALDGPLQRSPRMVAQRKRLEAVFGPPMQLRVADDEREPWRSGAEHATSRDGLPAALRSGIRHLSGMDLSDVRVHANSEKPSQLDALAYAQGNDIHLGPGQQEHLPHEAWHIVQQRQGRVQPTLQAQGLAINDEPALEREADVMGAKALQMKTKFSDKSAVNQGDWDGLWEKIGTYFDKSAKEWFDVAAKLGMSAPKPTEFGHGSNPRGGGSERANSRFSQLKSEIWKAARMDSDMPSSRAVAQLRERDAAAWPTATR